VFAGVPPVLADGAAGACGRMGIGGAMDTECAADDTPCPAGHSYNPLILNRLHHGYAPAFHP